MHIKRKRKKRYDSTKYNFNKPYLNNAESAAYIGCAAYTVRNSRSTGQLLGKPAPKYKKRGRSIIYELIELDRFNAQFPDFQNTAQYISEDEVCK